MKKIITLVLFGALLLPLGMQAATTADGKTVRTHQQAVRDAIKKVRDDLKNSRRALEVKDIGQKEKQLLQEELRRLDGRIEISRVRVMRNTNVEKKEKERVLELLKKREKWVEDLTVQLSKIDGGKNRKEVQRLAESIQKQWNEEGQEAKFRRTLLETRLLSTDNVIAKSEKLIADLGAEIARLQAKGADVSQAKEHLGTAKTHLGKSRDSREAASKEVQKLNNKPERPRAVSQEGRKHLKSSVKSLSNMDQSLKEATSVLRKK